MSQAFSTGHSPFGTDLRSAMIADADDVARLLTELGYPCEIDDAAERGATHVSLVPTLLDRIDATRWRTILLGGSAIPASRPSNTPPWSPRSSTPSTVKQSATSTVRPVSPAQV